MKEIAGNRWCSTCKLRPPVKKLPTTPPQLALVSTCVTATVNYRQATIRTGINHKVGTGPRDTVWLLTALQGCQVEGITHTCCTPQSLVSNCSRRLRVTGLPSARGLVSSTLWLTAKVAASTTPYVQEYSCQQCGFSWCQIKPKISRGQSCS